MVKRMFVFALGLSTLMLAGGCTKDDNPAAAQVTTDTYSGALVDPVLTQAMGAMYTGTTYVYSISSNDTFSVTSNIGFGAGLIEKGTYSVSGSTYTFTPLLNQVVSGTSMVDAGMLRPVYTGALSGATLTISHFINVANTTANQRDIGTLTVTKQ